EKGRLSYLLVGALVSTLCFTAAIVFGTIAGNALVALYLYLVSEMLLLSRLLDLDELLGRTAILTVFALVLTIIISFVYFIQPQEFGVRLLLLFAVSFVIWLLFEPLRAWVEDLVTRWLFREKHELR